MSQKTRKPDETIPAYGLLTEDTTVVSGVDRETGQCVTRAKTPDGKADKLTEATDSRENK